MATNTASPNTLSSHDIEQYNRDGFLIVRSVFNEDEMKALADESESLLERKDLIDTSNIRCRWQNHCGTSDCTFDCFDPVTDIGPVAKYFAYSPRLFAILKDLYAEEAYLFKDKMIFKRANIPGYALHQDFIGWDSFPESFLTVIVAIDQTNTENGATEVFPGYHLSGYMSPRDGEYHELPVSAIDESKGVILNLEPGDIAIFSGFTPHRSGPNLSDRPRRQLYLSYNSASDGGEQRTKHYAEFHAWLKEKYAQYGKTDVYFR